MREFHKCKSGKGDLFISENDVVLIIDEKLPRIMWRVGRVNKLIKSYDNVTRGAEIISLSKQGRKSVIKRPINKLVPLELSKTYTSERTNNSVDIC